MNSLVRLNNSKFEFKYNFFFQHIEQEMTKYENASENPLSKMKSQKNKSAVQQQNLDEKNDYLNYLIKMFYNQKRRAKFTRYFHKYAI